MWKGTGGGDRQEERSGSTKIRCGSKWHKELGYFVCMLPRFYVNLTLARVILKEKSSNEKMPPYYLVVRHCLIQ